MKYQIICLLLWSFKFEPWELTTFYGQCVCRTMISGTNGLSFKETWFPRTNGPKFPRKHASLGNGPKVMGKPWFCGEMGSSFEGTTWGKWISFICRMQFFFKFSFNMQLIIHTMQTFISTFHPYYATFFSNFHCQMLHNVDKINTK